VEAHVVRIAHVSDLHVGAEDGSALADLAAHLQATDVAATVVTGDLTMRARTREFVRARQVLDSFPAPVLVVIGNHDLPLANPLRRLASPYVRFRTNVEDDLDPVLDLPGVRIQGLASMPRWRWKSGAVTAEQTELIRATFAGVPSGVSRVVAMHHPPSSASLESLVGRADFEQALVDAQVDVVLAGHTHVPSARTVAVGTPEANRQVVEVVAGTATSHRTRGSRRSWSLLEFSVGSLTVTEHLADDRGWWARSPQVFALEAQR
jgi:3',5'-cyclic AMP phosphodiesterase CpdA